MLTGYSTWYTPYTGRIDGKKHVTPLQGAFRMTDISPYAHRYIDPNNPVHFHPSTGVYQTLADGTYISIPFPRTISQGVLHWRWANIKKRRAQFYKTRKYTKAKKAELKGPQRTDATVNNEISNEYSGYHKPHKGDYLDINA